MANAAPSYGVYREFESHRYYHIKYNMKCYQPLNVPNFEIVSSKVYNFIQTHTDILQRIDQVGTNTWTILDNESLDLHVPEINEYLTEQNLTKRFAAIIAVKGNSNLPLHVDTLYQQRGLRILWPIKNCDGVATTFYKVDKRYYRRLPPTFLSMKTQEENKLINKNYFHILDGPHEVLRDLTLSSPVIIDSSIPHAVGKVNSENPRLSLTIKTNEDLTNYFN